MTRNGSINVEFSERSLWNVLSCWSLLLVDSELIAAHVLDTITNFRLHHIRLEPFYMAHTQTETDPLRSR